MRKLSHHKANGPKTLKKARIVILVIKCFSLGFFPVWSLYLDCFLLIYARIMVPLVTLKEPAKQNSVLCIPKVVEEIDSRKQLKILTIYAPNIKATHTTCKINPSVWNRDF